MAAVKVELEGQDELICESTDSQQKSVPSKISIIGCPNLVVRANDLRKKFGDDPKKWELPTGHDHSDLLLREFILRCQDQWQYPYNHEELCHCRMIPTHVVDQAIIRGAHTPEKVSQMTSASTACGTCRLDVEKILAYRLNSDSK